MRGVAIVLISSLALLGCHGKKAVVEPTQPLSTLKNIDLEKNRALSSSIVSACSPLAVGSIKSRATSFRR